MEQQSIESFYNNEGWKLVGGNTHDALINENLTEVAATYVSQVRTRIVESLGSGNTLLDVGCGPIQYPEYVEYSRNFKTRVCVDLSEEALILAKEKVGSHGIFIQGDYLNLGTPKEGPFAGATLINVLYHVDKAKQETLVRKILSDLSPGANLVIVYSNPQTISAVVTHALVLLKRTIRKLTTAGANGNFENPIYFFRYPLSFWNRFEDIADVDKRAWRTFSPALEKVLFKRRLGGGYLLRVLYRIENFRWWVQFSEYTLIILKKN